jgi:predicted RNA-binding Zn ribbon-like protein
MADHLLPALRIVPHRFVPVDLCAGHPTLDFVNTAAGLNRDPRDWLDSFGALIGWARLSGMFDESLLGRLSALGSDDPFAAEAALAGAKALRAAVFTLVHHHRDATPPPTSAVETLQYWCRRAGSSLVLKPRPDGVLKQSLEQCGLDAIAGGIALTTADLFSRPLTGRFAICEGNNCGWVFLDTSRTRRRRWCDMKTCGNAAKASRHYRRRHPPPSLPEG